MVLPLPYLAALAAAAIAIGVGIFRRPPQQAPPETKSVTYVIGDLHGDADCGKYWVERLGLIENDVWMQPNATLVFLGDYVDKGPFSLQTIEFVKSLTDRFPDRVTALLGNHELELLRDRHDETVIKYIHYAFSAVHPEDFLNYIEPTEEDRQVIDVIVNASIEIYSHQMQRQMLATPVELAHAYGRNSLFELFDEQDRPYLQQKLASYQQAYLQAFASNTTLGKWLETRKVIHVENGVVFCHGGLSESIVDQINSVGGVDAFNELFQKNANDQTIHQFLQTPEGKTVYNLLVYRGNHQPNACPTLKRLLEQLNATKLAVGHTPGQNVRTLCEEQFWALDSLLGRWIRTSGNQYCPVAGRSSQNGKFVCPPLANSCMGQVTRFANGNVDILA